MVACTTAPRDWFVDATQYAPSAEYVKWWNEVEVCSGIKGNFNGVQWFHRPSFTGTLYGGLADWKRHRIVVLVTLMMEPMLIRHEMLHELLQTSEHPVEYFEEKCGSLVWH